MKKSLKVFLVLLVSCFSISLLPAQSDVILTAVWDGNLPGQLPKGVELYVINDVADMSIYGLGSANNGQGTDGQEFTFPAVAYSAGTYVYVASEAPQFTAFFGFAPNHTSSAVNVNGDDAIELFKDGAPVDVFGEIEYATFDGSWSYLNGWAYRVNGTGPDGTTYISGNWMLSGAQALAGITTNAAAPNPIPVGTYATIFSGSPTVSFVSAAATVAENAGSYELTVLIVNPDADNDTQVEVTVVGGTAIEGLDYEFNSAATVVFPAGSSMSQSVTITILNNIDEDGDRTIEFELQNPSNDANIGTQNLTLTIEDDDAVVPLFDIADLRDVDGNFYPTMFGTYGEIRGIVHGINFRPSGLEFTLIDNTDGIGVFRNTGNLGYTVQEGDSIHVIGTVGFFNGTTQFLPESIEFVEAGIDTNEPAEVTELNESTESNIVKLACVSLVDASQWTGTGAGFNVTVTNGMQTFTVRIRDAVDLYAMSAPTGVLNISGIGGQFDNSAPYNSGYQLFPRYAADITEGGEECITSISESEQVIVSLYPNPVVDNLNISSNIAVSHVRIMDISGRMVKQIHTNLVNIASINFSDLNSGIYLVEVVTNSGSIVKEIVKP
jgi:hypothetical protein